MNLSKTVTLKEATFSEKATRTGIDNTPNEEQIENMKLTAEKIVDPVRNRFPGTVINSFFRNPAVNKAVGGSRTSDHMTGRSVDLDSRGNELNNQIFDFIRTELEFDQCIGEYPDASGNFSWIHASRRARDNRGQVLVKLKDTPTKKNNYIPFGEWQKGMV